MPRINYRNKIIFSIVLIFIFLLLFGRNFHLTEWDYPLFIGDWDEAFTVNAAINVFYAGGFPLFYSYGGVCVYPQSLIFYVYEKITGQKPFYRGAGEFPPNSWPIYRRSYPINAIYIGRKFIMAVFSIMIMFAFYFMLKLTKCYSVSFLYALLLFIDGANVVFSQIIKPEIYVMSFTMLSYLTFLLCVKNKNYKYFLLQSVFCGLAIGSKLTSLSLIILSFFSAWVLSGINGKFALKEYIKMLFLGLMTTVLTFLITNPAILFASKGYFEMMKFAYNIHHCSPINWKNHFMFFLSWLKEHVLFRVKWINPNESLFLIGVAAILALLRQERYVLLATASFLILNIFEILNNNGLYSRLFIHLKPVIYFILLYPLLEIGSMSLRNYKLRHWFSFADKVLFIIILSFFSVVNLKWFNNYKQPVHNLKDSRIYLLQYNKSHQEKEFLIYNFHYYSMPDEFEKLHNVKVFEEIADLDKIAKPHQNYYIVYFDEKGGYCQWLPGGFKEKHEMALQYFKQFPKFKTIKGNYKKIFGSQAPETNPKVVIRAFK